MKLKKGFKVNAFCLLFVVIVLCGLASYFVTPGAFDREIINGRTVVIPGSYHLVEKTMLSPFTIFKAVPYGIMGASNIVVLILVVGGAIEIYNKSGSIGAGIGKLIGKIGNKSGALVISIFFIVFAILGGFLGWIEVCIPFAPLVIPILLTLGYDSIVAVSVLILGLMVGFAIGPTNLYTVGISHQIAQLPMFSGLGLRIVAYIVFISLALGYVLFYAEKIKKNPDKSLMKGIDIKDLKMDLSNQKGITNNQIIALIILGVTFLISVIGMLKLKWNIIDMSGAFLFSGIAAGIVTKMKPSKIADSFIEGTKNSMNGAMIVGIARGVQWILEQGGVIDPIIYKLSSLLNGLSPVGSAVGVLVVVTFLNALVPSGSGKAMALMPILMPVAQLIGITRQTMILAYQFGDGISNIFWFTYGTLLIFLAYGKVPIGRWYKFVLPLIGIMLLLAILFLSIAVKIGYGPA